MFIKLYTICLNLGLDLKVQTEIEKRFMLLVFVIIPVCHIQHCVD